MRRGFKKTEALPEVERINLRIPTDLHMELKKIKEEEFWPSVNAVVDHILREWWRKYNSPRRKK